MKNIKQKIEDLVKLGILNDSIVINEDGYGSFLEDKKEMVSFFSAAVSLDNESKVPKLGININKFFGAIIVYIKSQSFSTEDVPMFCSKQRYIIKRIDVLVDAARRNNLHSLKNILKWVIFNLKIQCLFKEINLIPCGNESKNTNYILNEIKSLAFLFNSKNLKDYNILSIDELEEEFRKKIMTLDEEIFNMIID